jgi:CheY-like chemotaxis protein
MPDEPPILGAKILVVDDAPPNVKLLRLILKDAGYRVLEASNGPDALNILHREKPDVMILDVRMPGMTGYEVCQEIRRDPEFSTLPVIMVTALSLPEERIMGIKAGATDFISKPFNKKELMARIQSSLVLAKNGKHGIASQLPGAIVITDPDWKILGISPLAMILLHMSPNIGSGGSDLYFNELFGPVENVLIASDKQSDPFHLQVPSTGAELVARQFEITTPGGNLVLRLITLDEAAS